MLKSFLLTVFIRSLCFISSNAISFFWLFQKGMMKTVAAITDKLKKLRAKYKDVKDSAKRSGNSRPKKPWKFMEKMDTIFKDNPTIDPPHLWDSSSSDHNREVYNGSSLENGRVFVLVSVVFLD